jgi:hypothetical protein
MQKKIPSYPAVGINIFALPCQRCRNNHLAAWREGRLSTRCGPSMVSAGVNG